MKRCFLKALWGIYDNSNRLLARRAECDGWAKKIKENEFTAPFITYVFGTDNFKHLEDMGFQDLYLVDSNPAPFDLLTEQYRHKLEIIRLAFEEGYEEVMHTDWDVVPQRPMDENFWKLMNEKEEFQANLQLYRRRKAHWRKEHLRKIPNGGFFYLRKKEYIYDIIKCWEKLRGPSCEPPMAKFTDKLMGGFDMDQYWDRFEPMTCDLNRCRAYAKQEKPEKTLYFRHYQG